MHPARQIRKVIAEILSNTAFRRYFFPRYTYMFTPPQLFFLCKCIEDTKHCEGAIGEVGCAYGETTIFLNTYMDAQNIQKDYYAVDTFSGLLSKDIAFEVSNRGKSKHLYTGCYSFNVNKKKWFDKTMQQNDITRVYSIEADINEYDLTTLGHLSFAILDVDLYQPMKKALPEVYEILSPGGIIVVDDCDPLNIRWDGSYQVYKEFIEEKNQPSEITHEKLGVIRKTA